ncbi:hypothetical protein D3C73_1383960 [compost metagenome]
MIGGGVSKAGEILFDAIRSHTDKYIMQPYRHTYRIVPAALHDNVGLIGAAALFDIGAQSTHDAGITAGM